MNTIPTTFNQSITPYTAVGGKERTASTGISAVILNRAGQYTHRTLFGELEKTGFDTVISIESSAPHYDIEELSGKFPFVRFILPEKEITLGEQINLAAGEVESPLFFVMRSDMKIIAGGTARKMAERLTVQEETDGGEKTSGFKRLCTVPVIVNSRFESLPTLSAPVTRRSKIRTVLMEPQIDEQFCLYPFEGIGIYDRRRFIQLGGYDVSITNKYWQFMDFGFRSYLWGEKIELSFQFKLSISAELPAEDYTTKDSYRRFYFKNLAPVLREDYAYLPFYRFPGFIFNSGEDIFTSWEDFSVSRKWVKTNKYRWKNNTKTVIKLWDNKVSI